LRALQDQIKRVKPPQAGCAGHRHGKKGIGGGQIQRPKALGRAETEPKAESRRWARLPGLEAQLGARTPRV